MAAVPADILAELGLGPENLGCYDGAAWRAAGGLQPQLSPSTGAVLAQVRQGSEEDYEACMAATVAARRAWAETPAPARGEVVRKIGDALRAKKQALGTLISLEMGKVLSEGLGEVQGVYAAVREGAGAHHWAGAWAGAPPKETHSGTTPPLHPSTPLPQSSLTCATMPWGCRAC
jgi:acyl-CoA reductase-like NAD-dependent aldehyde dehydrogenase